MSDLWYLREYRRFTRDLVAVAVFAACSIGISLWLYGLGAVEPEPEVTYQECRAELFATISAGEADYEAYYDCLDELAVQEAK